jgi:hypothetical protein
VKLSTALTEISGSLLEGTKIKSISLHEGITKIGGRAFGSCRNLNSIVLPDSVEYIGSEIFDNWLITPKVNIPANLKFINTFALSGLEFTSLIFPEGMERIYISACFGTQATHVTLPSSIKEVGDFAFAYCTLQTLTIYAGAENIHPEAFVFCEYLTDVYYFGTPEQWDEMYQEWRQQYEDRGIPFDPFPASDPVIHFMDESQTKDFAPSCESIGGTGYFCTTCETYHILDAISALGHLWGEKTVLEIPTCVKDGKEMASCERDHCDKVEYWILDRDPTNHEEYTTVIVPPTCTEKGHTCERCVCGYEKDARDEVDALGHVPGDWTVIIEPTVGTEGKKQQSCTVCDAILNEETIPALPEETVPETAPETDTETAPETTPDSEPETGPDSEPETEAPSDEIPETSVETTETLNGGGITIPIDGCSGSILSCGLLMLIALAGAALIKRKE